VALRGTISREPRLSRSEWLRCIEENATLVADEARVIVNPFTGDRVLHQPPPGGATLCVGGATVGGIEPSVDFEDDGELLVYAPEDSDGKEARIAAEVVAKALGAQLDWIEEEN
jgi:hypothetical protein